MAFFPLRLVPDKTNIDFMGKRWLGFIASGLLTIASLAVAAGMGGGLNWGIDFTGGLLFEVRTSAPADLAKMRTALADKELGEVSLQNFGDDRTVLIRIQVHEEGKQQEIQKKVKDMLATGYGQGIEYRKQDYVGPTVGRELVHAGILATVLAFASIMVYVWFRFEWQFGFGAILALTHDVIMMVGFFAFTGFEFGLTAVAAVLTIIGYSINDSVVIYDRIRENMRKYKKMPMMQLLNHSINETISRTVLTAATTLIAALALAFFGGEALRGFSLSLAFGIVVGTYSSIYISAPILVYLNIRRDEAGGAAEAKPA